MLKTENDLQRFQFKKTGYGRYSVKYTSGHGDFWIAEIACMPLIDYTLYAEKPRQKDITWLRSTIKRTGSHYSKYGIKIS